MTLPPEFDGVVGALDELQVLILATVKDPYDLHNALDIVRDELTRALDGMALLPEEDARCIPRVAP